MKKLMMMVGVVMGLMAGAAMADDGELVTVDGKKILVTGAGGGRDNLIHSRDIPDGIFIRVSDGGACSVCGTDLPNATALVKARFKAAGFKLSESVENSSMAIQFAGTGAMNIVAANNKAGHSILPSSGKVIASIGAMAAGMAQGGIAAGAGYIVGAFFPTDDSSVLTVQVSKKPKFNKGWFGNVAIISSVDSGDEIRNFGMKYRLDKEDPASEDIVLKAMVDKWIKWNMALDTTAADTTPAANTENKVTTAATTEETKKQ